MRENKDNHSMILKNITFKNTYTGKLKKIPLVKNIVKEAFSYLYLFNFLWECVLTENLESMALRDLK